MSLSQGTSYDPAQIPALQPPPGVVPNFNDPYTRGPMLLALSAVAIAIMVLFVIVRIYCKVWVQRKISWDDLTCTIATLGTTGIFIGLIFLEKAGLGTHQWNLRAVDLIQDSFLKVGETQQPKEVDADLQGKPLYILVNIQPLVSLFMKLSFHIFFFQIFSPKPALKWSIIIGGIVTTVFYIATTVILFVLSTPGPGVTLAEQFQSFLGRKTSPVLSTTFAIGYFNILSDLYLLVLPISGVMGLNLKRKRKVGVILIFMTGLLALGSSSASLYYRYLVDHSGDTTWNLMPAAYLSILELSVGIDCSCMPLCASAMRGHVPLFVSFKSSLTSFWRTWGARLSRRAGSGYSSHSMSGSPSRKPDPKRNPGNESVVALKDLPQVSKGIHQMKTARAFIWGGKHHGDAIMDDEETILSS